MRTCLLLLILLPSTGASCLADEPPSDVEAQVRKLIQELDAETRSARLAAERQIRELGPQVLPFLPAPELTGPGARESLAKLRFELERRQARETLRPSRVTLDGTRTVRDWLAILSHQSGNPVDGSKLPQATLSKSISFAPRPAEQPPRTFWEAVSEVSRQAALQPGGRTPRGALMLVPAAELRPLAEANAGSFRAAIREARLREGLTVGEDLLRLDLEFEAEPRLRPLFARYAARDVTAGDLTPLSPDARYEVLIGDTSKPARIQCDFRRPRLTETDRIDLNAKLSVTVAASNESIRFSGLNELAGRKEVNVARRRGGVTVTIHQVSVRGNKDPGQGTDLEVRVRVNYDLGGPAFESYRAWLSHNRAHLELPDKRIFELNGGLETTEQSDGGQGAAYTFRGVPDLPGSLADVVFVYVAPTLIVEVPVEFSFRQIPIRPSRP